MINGQAETNACFIGKPSSEPYTSWSSRTLSYSASAGGQFKADFGGTINADLGAQGGHDIQITLKDMSVEKLEGLYFDPKSPCATDDTLRARYMSPGGVDDAVITRALRAGTIDVTDSKSGGVTLGVQATAVPVGGNVGVQVKSTSEWQGAQLFIASYLERFKVTFKAAPACSVSVASGQTCDLEACSVKIDAVNAEEYNATLSCQDGSTYPIAGKLGLWAGQQAAPGVSYSLRVSATDQVGVLKTDFFRWNVLSH